MTDNIHKRIGERLKLALELRGMGVSELACKAGVSQGYVSFIINNKRHPTIKTMEKFANALGVPLSFFFEEKIIPLQSIYHRFPPEILEFLAKERSIDYIVLAKEADENDISPEDIKTIISIIKKNRK